MSIGNRAAFAHAPIDGRAVTEFEPKGKAAGERRELFNQMEKVPWPAPVPARGAQGAAAKGKRSAGGDDRTRRGQPPRLEAKAWRQLKMLANEQGTISHDLPIQAVNLLFDHDSRRPLRDSCVNGTSKNPSSQPPRTSIQ